MVTMEEAHKEKYDLMLKIERYERALIELERWDVGSLLSSSVKKITGEILNEESKHKWMKALEDFSLLDKKRKRNNDNKLYLSEIVELEKQEFSKSNLILAPTGSGKTHLMRKLIKFDRALLLVSTTSLKDNLVPKTESEKEKLGNRMYSTKHKSVYGKASYKILVMTYSEFSELIEYDDHFANEYKQVFCDEIHSLFHYNTIGSSNSLSAAIKYLFADKDNQDRYYFTATDEHLSDFTKKKEDFFKNVMVLNYLDHPDIVKHMTLSSYKISGLEKVRPHLKARKESFKYFDYKIFAFCKTIRSQLYLEKIIESEGFKPLTLWSVNNKDHPMDEEQLRQRDYVLRTGLIPDGYDTLIINSSMQEGWDLLDPQVKLVVMNTTNKTEFVQAIGRVRQDVDILVYKVDSSEFDYYISFPESLLDVELTSQMKQDLSESLKVENKHGRILKWPSIKKALEKQGMVIKEKIVKIDNKATRVSIVSHS